MRGACGADAYLVLCSRGERAEVFGRNSVSIERVWQEGFGEQAALVFITHRAQEGPFQKTVQELRERDAVRAVVSLLRVEGEE